MSMHSQAFPSKNERKPGEGALVVPLETLVARQQIWAS